MQNEELKSNTENEFDTISAAPNDVTSNYTIVPNALIRDTSISPDCRWLIIYLLSNKPGWKIKVAQLANHTKGFLGRDKTRKIFDEAVEAGYIKKSIVYRHKSNGKGMLRGVNYQISSAPIFKKCLRNTDGQYTDHQCTDHQDPDGQYGKEVTSKELLSKDNNSLKVQAEPAKAGAAKAAEKELNVSKKSKEFTEQVISLTDKMLALLKAHEIHYKVPKNLSAFMTHVDFMLRLDEYPEELILDVLAWALADSFWNPNIYNEIPSKYLRTKFLQLKKKMESKPPEKERKFAPSSNDERSLKKMEEWSKGAI